VLILARSELTLTSAITRLSGPLDIGNTVLLRTGPLNGWSENVPQHHIPLQPMLVFVLVHCNHNACLYDNPSSEKEVGGQSRDAIRDTSRDTNRDNSRGTIGTPMGTPAGTPAGTRSTEHDLPVEGTMKDSSPHIRVIVTLGY
jgi:hypothetical protein